MARHLGSSIIAVGMIMSTPGCLPVDGRPPPAEVRFVAAPGDDPAGVVTGDGWTIAVERLLVGIGDASLGYPCERYSDSPYLRLLDGTRPGDQKISTVYGLGRCEFTFRVVWPDDAAVLGEGVTQDDLVRMSTALPLPSIDAKAGIGVEFAATATKDSIAKHFSWSFRQATTYNACGLGAKNRMPFEFKSDEGVTERVFLSGAAIFASDASEPNEIAPLAFDAVAAADDNFGNRDGEVTLEEIDAVLIAEARNYGPYGLAQATDVRSLLDYFYLQTLGNVARFRDGVFCSPELGIRQTH